MFNRIYAVVIAGLLISIASTAIAGEIGVSVVFSDGEISAIRAYYRDHDDYHGGKQGNKKHGGKSLPPGIAKNLQRGKPLPPGIAKQALPGGLINILPPVPRGFERVIIDGRMLLVEIATQVIHDVLEEAILR